MKNEATGSDNPKCKKSSKSRLIIDIDFKMQYGSKILLCIWWDMKIVVYYKLLKPNQIVDYYQQQLIVLNCVLNQKRPIIAQRKRKFIARQCSTTRYKSS